MRWSKLDDLCRQYQHAGMCLAWNVEVGPAQEPLQYSCTSQQLLPGLYSSRMLIPKLQVRHNGRLVLGVDENGADDVQVRTDSNQHDELCLRAAVRSLSRLHSVWYAPITHM
jgi:hypothetical protein